MRELDRRLGAWYYDGSLSQNKALEDQAKSFLCYLENVFGHFYEWKTRICDHCPIQENYRDDWDHFLRDVGKAAEAQEPFNGICPVMHIKTLFDGQAYVIEDIGIRPCAIQKKFFEAVLRVIAENVLKKPGTTLVIKIFGVRRVFAESVLNHLNINVEHSEERAVFGPLPGLRPEEEPRRRIRLAPITTEAPPTTAVFKLDPAALTSLVSRVNKITWEASRAAVMNDFTRINETRTDLITSMLDEAHSVLKQLLTDAPNVTHVLQQPMQLVEKDLMVYKYGAVIKYLPDEGI